MLPDEYGCVVANRFGLLLDDEGDPFDQINEAVEKDKRRRREQNKPEPNKKPGQRESQKDRPVQCVNYASDTLPGQKQSARGGLVQNEGRGAVEAEWAMKRSGFGERRTNQEQRPQEFSVQRPSYDDSQSWVRGGGRRGRGGFFRNTEDFNPTGKREYDRHSGTGLSPEEKRGGRGPWNWGSRQDSIGDGAEAATGEAFRPEEPQQDVGGQGENQASDAVGEVVVQVSVEMSLDEWKAKQERSRPKVEFNLRKTDSKVPHKATVIHKSKYLEKAESMEEAEDDGHNLRRPVNDITSRLDINFGSLQRPGRGGRGRGRGGRGSPTSCPERVLGTRFEKAPDPDDPEDFPALAGGR